MEIIIGHFLSVIILFELKSIESTCTWPSPFVSSTWTDSTHGDLIFNTTTMSGYSFIVHGQPVNDWVCAVSNSFQTDGRLILVSATNIIYFSNTFYVYLCMTFSKITDVSYRYYQNNEDRSVGDNRYRLILNPVNIVTNPGTICEDNLGASGPEYQVVIKKGSDSDARVNCPYSFLGEYGYKHTDSSGSVTCDTENSSLDMCTDNTLMTFDYTKCSTKVAYSASNTVWCVDTVPIGTTNYVMVFNGGESETSIDNVEVYRYACFAISEDSTKASVTPQHCKAGQIATAIPTDNAGVLMGATLEMVVKQNCTSCPVLTAPVHGFVTVSTMGTVTKANYECEVNYTLSGVSERLCRPNNSWTDTAPSCSCAPPPTPGNGTLVVSADGFQANYTCNLGFSLRGRQVRQCLLANSEWEDVDPECVQCSTVDVPEGGDPIYSSDTLTTKISFTCDKGYTMSGSQSLTCLSTGAWDNEPPICAKCPPLTNPLSGSVSTSTDGFTTTAAYTCAAGYDMVGEPMVTCLDTGSWNLDPPTCVCQTPNVPDHGAVVADGATATYTCDIGYTINGVTSRTCNPAGTGWSETDPICSFCVEISPPIGGDVNMNTNGVTTSAKYTCDSGYTLKGSSTITCQSNGNWNTGFSSCEKCPGLSDPSSGTVTVFTSGTISSATYSCFEGYDLNGVTVRECLPDGTWQSDEPTCNCQSPSPINNGQLTEDGKTATYTCDLDYSLNGMISRSCQTDGSGWSGPDPYCATCGTLANPTGGTVIKSTDGINTKANYTCESGYTLSGAPYITCRSDGSWDFQQPNCVLCPSLTDPDSGLVLMSTNGLTTTAAFSCVTGYYISGASSLTCRTNGAWDNTPPTCKCNFPMTPANGEVSVSDTSGSSVAIYKCESGFTLTGLSTRQCQTDGSGWEGLDPICVSCEPLSAPSSGKVDVATNGLVTTARFQCDIYTSLDGEAVLSCQSGGGWDSLPPTCVPCPSLSEPSTGLVTITTNGITSSATYTCVSGYALNSTGILTCRSDGIWNLPVPTCVCETPPSPSNGLVTILNDGWLATYSCNEEYELTGLSERACLSDGTGWEGVQPICVAVPTTTTEKPGIVSTPLAVLVVLGLVIFILMVLLVIFAVLYLKVRYSRIGASSERLVEEPEKPSVVPNVAVPPRDTAKTEPNQSPAQISPLSETKNIKKAKKDEKAPAVVKSPTILSASGVNVDSFQTSTKERDDQTKNEKVDKTVSDATKKTEQAVAKKASPKTKKKSVLKKLPLKIKQEKIKEPKPPSPSIISPVSSMDIPIFDEEEFTVENVTNGVVKVEEPKAVAETINENKQDNDDTFTTNVHPVRLPPISKPPVGHGFVLNRKRKRLTMKNISFKDDIRETRPRTPVEKRIRELGIERIMTPDLLQQVAFNYLHPVILRDAPSSAKSGRSSTISGRTFASYT